MRHWAAVLCLVALVPTISAVHADEPGWTRLTTDGLLKQRPHWSPDGRTLLFARHRADTIYLYLRDLKSGEETRLGKGTNAEFDGVFSPDGTSVLFTFDKTTPGQGDMELQRITLKERTVSPVVGTEGALSHEEFAAWSPDGKRFAYTSTHDGNQELYLADIDGSNRVRLTTDPAIDAHPAWSPDGKSIVFATNRWGDLEIAVVQADGSNLRRLTHSKGLDDYPVWSPDGRFLAHTSNRDGNFEIYVSTSTGELPVNATNSPTLENFAAWSPDGLLGFVSNADGGFDLYTTTPSLPR